MKISRIVIVVLLAAAMLIPLSAFGQRKVLLEKFTGTWCGWCPYGSEVVHGLKANYGDDLILLEYHGGRDSEPMQTEKGNVFMKFMKPAYPQAAIDRIRYPGTTKDPISRGDWKRTVDYRMSASASAGIDLEGSKYDKDTRELNLTVKITPLRIREGKFRINVVVSEDHLKYEQSIYAKPYSKLTDYYHSHVVRDMITGSFGEPIDFSGINFEAPRDERNMVKNFTFKLNPDYVDANCHIVVFINQDDGEGYGPVLQAEELHIAQLLPRPERRR